MSESIDVKKRNGRLQKLDINKSNLCTARACENLENVSASEVVLDAHVQLYDKITTKEIDKALILSARQKIEKEPNYNYVASKLLLFNIHKEVFGSSVDKEAFEHQYRLSFVKNIKLLAKEDILSEKLLDFDLKKLSKALRLGRDFQFKYLGLQTLYDRYLLRINDRRLEAPQSCWMRVAMGLALNEKNKEQKDSASIFSQQIHNSEQSHDHADLERDQLCCWREGTQRAHGRLSEFLVPIGARRSGASPVVSWWLAGDPGLCTGGGVPGCLLGDHGYRSQVQVRVMVLWHQAPPSRSTPVGVCGRWL